LIAEPDASEQAVTEAVNDTLKAIAASLLMEQVLAPRFEFKPKHPNNEPTPGFDYGPGGYDPAKTNVGYNPVTGNIQLEIKGLAEPKSKEAERICQEDLNELVTAFVQDKPALEKGLFAGEELVPEELTQVRMGKIIQEKFPNLDDEDREAVRQHAIAALNMVQQAKKALNEESNDSGGGGGGGSGDGCEGAGNRSDRSHQPLQRSLRHPRQGDERGAVEAGGGGDRWEADEPDAGRGEGPCHPGVPLQERAGTAAGRDFAGCVGKAHGGRSGGVRSFQG
jgi:hypothetical protein